MGKESRRERNDWITSHQRTLGTRRRRNFARAKIQVFLSFSLSSLGGLNTFRNGSYIRIMAHVQVHIRQIQNGCEEMFHSEFALQYKSGGRNMLSVSGKSNQYSGYDHCPDTEGRKNLASTHEGGWYSGRNTIYWKRSSMACFRSCPCVKVGKYWFRPRSRSQ